MLLICLYTSKFDLSFNFAIVETGISINEETAMEDDRMHGPPEDLCVNRRPETIGENVDKHRHSVPLIQASGSSQRDRMETCVSPALQPHVHNIQAMAENNYLKMRTEFGSGDSEMLDLASNESNINFAQNRSLQKDSRSKLDTLGMTGLESSGSNTHAAQMDIVGSLSMQNLPANSMTPYGDFEYANKSIKSRDNSSQPESRSSRKGVTVQPSMSGPSIHLQQSEYISMLTLPVAIREEACNKCDIEHNVSHREQTSQISVVCPGENEPVCGTSTSVETIRQQGECFKLDLMCTQSNSINYLPPCVLVQILRNLTVFGLLQRASLVCKYWYNLCRDPDLWVNISLVNQHRLKDAEFKKAINHFTFYTLFITQVE